MQALESQSVSLFPSACFYSGVSIPGLHLVPHFYDYNKSRLKEKSLPVWQKSMTTDLEN